MWQTEARSGRVPSRPRASHDFANCISEKLLRPYFSVIFTLTSTTIA